MSRRYPNRRRKRPGRPPPNRYSGGSCPVRPNSFQDLGVKTFYDWLLPRMEIRDRRQFFNLVGIGWILGAGLFGAVFGFNVGGPPGAILGGALAMALLTHALRKHRFIR
jgi:hypothetical protein